jgi:hypothetical protein
MFYFTPFTNNVVQQPDGDDSPGIVAAPILLLGIAKLELSVIADVPEHVVIDRVVVGERVGVGTVIRGLRPGAVVAEGVVASLKSGVAIVLEGASVGIALPTNELVSVVSVLLVWDVPSAVVVDGVHSPIIVDMPNGDVIGGGATEGVKLMKGLGVAEEEDATPPFVIAVPFALAGAELVAAAAGHVVMPPSGIPEFGPKLPV